MATSRDDFGIAIRSALLQRGARQKFSLFVLIVISIAIFALDISQLKPIKILRSLLNDGVYRVSVISSSPIRFTSATKNFFVEHMFIYRENEKLKSEVEQLKKEKYNTSYLKTENKKLQEIVKLDKDSGFITVGAKIMMDKNEKVSLATVYNTVHALKNKGYLKEISLNTEKSYFDTNISNHHHFLDEETNTLLDLDEKDIEKIKVKKKLAGKKIKSIEVLVRVANNN